MTDFTPWQSLLGGALIGLSAVLLMALHGRIAGISGILSGLITPLALDWQWRLLRRFFSLSLAARSPSACPSRQVR